MAGRPRVYENSEDLQAAIDAYFLEVKTNNEKVTMSGLAYALGFADRQSLYDYEKNEQFSCTIKRALLRIEGSYETALYGNSVAGPIFALKNMGWKDKAEMDLRTPEGITVNYVRQQGNEPLADGNS
jgi:hypothetical protein